MALSFRTQQRLASVIQAIAEGEKKTEVVRQVLAEQRLFEPHTTFRRLDLTRDGYVSNSELTEFLNSNNVIATSKEVLALFAGLDFNEDGLVSYNDFVQTLLPQEDEKLKTLATLRESYFVEPGEALPYEVEWGLTRVFEQEIKNYRNIENLKDILSSSLDYNVLDAFNTIDEELLGFIDFESIDKFQRANSKVLSEDEIEAFLRVVGDNGRITYAQFSNAMGGQRAISQISPSKYDRIASPYRSRDLYYEELTLQLERSRRQGELEESRARLNRSIDLQRSQEKLERSIRVDREIELQRSQEKLERSIRVDREIQLQRSQEKLERSIRVDREIQRQRSQEKLAQLERSIDLQRSQEKLNRLERSIELQRSLTKADRSIELQRSADKLEKQLERQRSQERINRLERTIERQRSIDRLNRSIEQQSSASKLQRTLEKQRSQERLDNLERSINRQRSQEKLSRIERDLEIQRSLRKSQEKMERTLDMQRSQDRLNRSIERSRVLEAEADLLRSKKKREQDDLEMQLELQRSINRSRKLENDILDASLGASKASFYNTPSRQQLVQSQYVDEAETGAKQSPMKGNEEQHLVKALKEQINIDREIEEIRKQLSLRVDFNLLDGFRIFDNKGRGYVTKLELEMALNQIGIYPTKDELYLLFKTYDTDSDGLLRYSEFTKIVSPQSAEYATLMSNRAPHYLDNAQGLETFEFETQFILKKLLNKVIQGEGEAESLRQKLARRPLFSSTDAFNSIDQNENGFISIEEFKSILNCWGFFVTGNDLVTLVSRYDKNQDGKVSYGEFLSEITPKSPLKY